MSCYRLAEELLKRVGEELVRNGCDCILFSGGVDTTFVALAAVESGLRPTLVTVLAEGNADEHYARVAGAALGLRLVEVRPSLDELLGCADQALRAMTTIDPIEVISASAVCAGLAKAKELGCRCVATGDGGDELFLGYGFLHGLGEGELKAWLDRVSRGAFFNSVEVGRLLGVKVVLPLYSEAAKSIALRAFEEGCDIMRFSSLTHGKALMRMAIASRGLADVGWRLKTPITAGTGVEAVLGRMRSLVAADEVVGLSGRTGIKLPSYAHAYLLKRRLELSLPLPERAAANGCPICGAPLRDNFCRFCGAYVLGPARVSVYHDDAARLTGAAELIPGA